MLNNRANVVIHHFPKHLHLLYVKQFLYNQINQHYKQNTSNLLQFSLHKLLQYSLWIRLLLYCVRVHQSVHHIRDYMRANGFLHHIPNDLHLYRVLEQEFVRLLLLRTQYIHMSFVHLVHMLHLLLFHLHYKYETLYQILHHILNTYDYDMYHHHTIVFHKYYVQVVL